MSTFFTRARFGRPQLVAGLFLLAFLGQSLWLAGRGIRTVDSDPSQCDRLQQGLMQWHGKGIAGGPIKSSRELGIGTRIEEASASRDFERSPLYYLVASFPLLAWPGPLEAENVGYWGWLARAPSLLFGLLLGGSVWYVSHRLYGDAGGYVALALYCFSPGIIRSSAAWFAPPETGAAWAAFGAIFTAIAVAHTLYAPREVVLWNWRRIVLLGLALALAVGSQFTLVVVVPVALGFLLYLAPTRRAAAVVIWIVACGVAFLLLFAAYFFRARDFLEGLRQAHFTGFVGRAVVMPANYRYLTTQLTQASPAILICVPAALIAYGAWPKARYFGNTAPLLVAAFFLMLGLASPHYTGLGFRLLALPFLFLFSAGVGSDLLETRYRRLVQACLWGLLAAYGLWSLTELARV